MKTLKRISAVFLALAIVIGMLPAVNAQAKGKYDFVGSFYMAKGETETFVAPSYKGKISVIDAAGNKVKIVGKKIKVTGKKTGTIMLKVGKKKIGFDIMIGGNNEDPDVNYEEYSTDFVMGEKEYENYIDYARDCVKKGKEINFIWWDSEEQNETAKAANRGVFIGEEIFDVNEIYPSWCDYGGGTTGNGDKFIYTRCAMYYDKTSNCIFNKMFFALEKDNKIDEIRWSCWKNNSGKYELEKIFSRSL